MKFALISCVILLFGFTTIAQSEKIPRKISKSPETLAQHLTAGLSGKEEKARAIHDWIINNIAYDYDQLNSDKCLVHKDGTTVLKAKKAVCSGYVELYREMLAAVNIESETIVGYVRPDLFADSAELIADSHAWIAINLDGEWKMADPTWNAGYIGLIPTKPRKPWTPKERKKPYKSEEHKKRVQIKIEKKLASEKEKEKNRKKYTDKVGFVKQPTEKWYMSDPDTFLMHHLPIVDFWQQRSRPILPEEFVKDLDTLSEIMADNQGELDFESHIDEYLALDFLQRMIYLGDHGLEFNKRNVRLKAIQYYNYLAILNNKTVRKQYKNLPNYQLDDLYAYMLQANDTMLVYAKKFNTEHKLLHKRIKTYNNTVAKEAKNRTKLNTRLISKGLRWNEKAIENAGKANERIVEEQNKLLEMEAKIMSRYRGIESKALKDYAIDSNLVQHWIDSLTLTQQKFDGLLKAWNGKREKPTIQSISNNLQYVDYLMEVNHSYTSQNNLAYDEDISMVDSIILSSLIKLDSLYNDSLVVDILAKDVYKCIKKMQTHVSAAKKELRAMQEEGKVRNTDPYNRFFHKHLLLANEKMFEANRNALPFNRWMGGHLKTFQKLWKTVEARGEEIEKANLNKKEELLSEAEHARKRDADLYKSMKTDGASWKKLFQGKLK